MRGLRLRNLAYLFLLIVAVLIGRLFQLQIKEHDYWLREARNSRLDRESIPFRRGRILDRNEKVLAMDKPSYDLSFRYRDFRRGHIAGQLHEALALMGVASGGLEECMADGERLGRLCFSWTPKDLRSITPRQRGDLMFYLRGIAEMPSSRLRLAVQEWADGSEDSFGEHFPQAFDGLSRGLVEARREIALLEELLGPAWRGTLLPKLELRRQVLEGMVLTRALQECAGRALGISSYSLLSRIAKAGEERDQALQTLSERWSWQADPAALGALLKPLGGAAKDALDAMSRVEKNQLLDNFLSDLEKNHTDDATGVRRSQARRIHQYRVKTLKRDLSFELVDLLAQQSENYQGLYLQEVARRIYPNEISPMLVGNVRKVDPDETSEFAEAVDRFHALRRIFIRQPEEEAEFRKVRDWLWSDALRPDELRGATGIELVYEDQLRGSRGYLQVLEGGEGDGRPLELLFSKPRDGTDITLSLDVDLAHAAQRSILKVYRETPSTLASTFPETPAESLRKFNPNLPRVGFALLDLRNGETPLLMSTPGFSREEFRTDYQQLAEIKAGNPLRNRALGGGYLGPEVPYPGSTFKPLVAAAALSLNPNYWNKVYHCEGAITPISGGTTLKCDSKWGHQDVAMREALKRSCNVYFYLLARDIGADVIYAYAKGLGFDRPTGLELVRFDASEDSAENLHLSGDVRLERKANYLSDKKSLQDNTIRLMRTAIGQVGVQASPLQMARMYGWLATGELLQPRLVHAGGGGSPAREQHAVPVLSASNRALILDALYAVGYEDGGTAARTKFNPEWQIVCKTGTAQIFANGLLQPTHAWLTGFFPRDNPRYSFAILCENVGLHGGQIASFILKEFLKSPEAKVLFE
ncbi:MAG: penicillin-binding transpeptidase domain-containing protein [Planctomycetota bacterium]